MLVRINNIILYCAFLFTSLFLQAQHRVYLYINQNDCSTCNAGSAEIGKIHQWLKPTLLFSDLDSTQVEYGIKEVLRLQDLELPYEINSKLVNKIKKHTKDVISRLVVVNEKGNIVFDCDIKYIGQNIEKINSYVTNNFNSKSVLISKSNLPVSFGSTKIAHSKSFLCVRNDTEILFYSTINWQNTSKYIIKEHFKPEELYVKYMRDTLNLAAYTQQIKSSVRTVPAVSFSDNFCVIGDSLFMVLNLSYPSGKKIIFQGKEASVWSDASFLVLFYRDNLINVLPVHQTLPGKDTVSYYMGGFWTEQDTFYFQGCSAKNDKEKYTVKCVLNKEGIYPVKLEKSFFPKTLIALGEKENLSFDEHHVINNKYLYFNAHPEIYNVKNQQKLRLPFDNAEITFREGYNIKISFYMVDFQYFRQKMYGIYMENDKFFYFSLDKNGKIDKKIPLSSEKRKSKIILYKGMPCAISQEGNFIRYE